MIKMTDTEVLWRLYERKNAYNKEYNEARVLPATVKQVYNPLRKIINTDKALLLKGLQINADEKYQEALSKCKDWNNWDFLKTRLALFLLMEGYVGVQVVPVKENGVITNVDLIVYEKSQVKDVKRDTSGAVVYVELTGQDDNNNQVSLKITPIEYEYRVAGKLDEERSGYNAWGKVPFFEYFGLSGKDVAFALGRVDSIQDAIDQINKYEWDLREISDLHANPPVVGKFGEIEDDTKNEHTNQAEGDEYITTGQSRKFARVWDMEEGTAKYLEMQGNIAMMAKEEKEKIQETLMKEYPELLLAEIASGSGMSGYAISLKLTDLVSIIEDYRARMKEALRDTWNMAGEMLSLNWEVEISFKPVLEQDSTEKLKIISDAVDRSIMPRRLAVKLIVSLLDLDESAEEVWEMLQKEEEVSAEGLRIGAYDES